MDDVSTTKLRISEELGIINPDEGMEQTLRHTKYVSENAIPVPPMFGELWKERYLSAKVIYKDFHDDWQTCFDEFNKTGSIKHASDNDQVSENYVRSTIHTMLDYTYMRNPDAVFNTTNEKHQAFAEALSRIITNFVQKNNGNGLNLRAYMQKLIHTAHLSNFGIMKIDYTTTRRSRQEAFKVYNEAIDKLKDAKEISDIERLSEHLNGAYNELQDREDLGICLKNRPPFNIYVDPECIMDDFTDAKWLMDVELISESHIKSEYMYLDEALDEYVFKYDQKTIFKDQVDLNKSEDDLKTSILNELMPDVSEDIATEKLKGKIPCVWIYDKTTRRKYLYMLDRWDVPLWVFEDDLKLSRFFPYFKLGFSPSQVSVLTKGEASFYIPFQREINYTHKQFKYVRDNAFSLWLYNASAITGEEVDRVVKESMKKSTGVRTVGVKLKDTEVDINTVLKPFMTPPSQIRELFDSTKYSNAIRLVSRITASMSGGEFRTNTTNQAVDVYRSQTSSRIEGFVDPIEDVAGQILWAIAEIIVSLVDKDVLLTVAAEKDVEQITTMPVTEFNKLFHISIEAGSSEKMNTAKRKEEALSLMQILGQFGKAAPKTTIGLILKMVQNAFGGTLVTQKDLDTLKEEGDANMQKGISTEKGNEQ